MATQPGSLSQSIHQATAWEEAYSRFETPEQEIKKFTKRLKAMGFLSLKKDVAVVELFCGRGNGLIALSRMGFSRIDGVDLSPFLLSQYSGTAECHVADCRSLPFERHSKNVVVIQGGLHHLQLIPDDLDRCLREIHRILSPQGQVFIVEPWLTPFLAIVHAICKSNWIRRVVPKIDALATMIEQEQLTYFRWLKQPKEILRALNTYFVCERAKYRWGKLIFIGTVRNRSLTNAPW
jgi:ubiquinone/menaquinone biosynthesis C-methylase UbiE